MVTKTERFLYSMLKNADLKTLNWDLVGAENGINPNAARTRWYRFEKLMLRENAFQPQGQSAKQQNPAKGKTKNKLDYMIEDDEDPPKPLPVVIKARDFGVKKERVKEEDLLQDVKVELVQGTEQHSSVVGVKQERDLFW